MWQDNFDTSIEEKAEQLWKWFKVYERGLFDAYATDDPLVAELMLRLQVIDQRLVVDLGKTVEGKREMVISAGGRKELFTMVMFIVDEAPVFKYFRIKAFTPRRPVHMEVVMEELKLKADDMFFTYEKNKKGQLKLTVFPLAYDSMDERYERLVRVMIEALLGEYDAVMKVGKLEVISLRSVRDMSSLLPLVRLPSTLDKEVGRN